MEWGSFGKGVVIPATQIERIKTSISGGDHELILRQSDSFEVKDAIYFHIDPYPTYDDDSANAFLGVGGGLVGCFITLNSDISYFPTDAESETTLPFVFVSALIDEEVWSLDNSIKILQLGEYGEGGYWEYDSDWLVEVAKWNSDNEPIYIIKQAPPFRLLNWNQLPWGIK